MTRWLLPTVLCVVLILASACRGTPPTAEAGVASSGVAGSDLERPATLVETVTLIPSSFRDFLELNGVTRPVRSANISAQMGGRIVTMDLVKGEDVSQGQEVLRINTRPIEATIDRLEVELDQFQSDIERTQRLVERGLGTEATLEQLNTRHQATEAAIDEIRINLREARTHAPIDGTVTDTYFEVGEFVGPGTPVARIVDIGSLIVDVGISERDIIHLRQDMPVAVRIEASQEVVQGRIRTIGLEANTNNRRFPAEIEIDNPDRRLRAGMRATVMILKRNLDNAIVIPRDVLVQSIQGSEVYVVDNGEARVRPVRLGPGLERYVVVEEGLSGGEQLVVRGQRDLVEREPVTATDRGSCCQEQMDEYRESHQIAAAAMPETVASP